MGKTQVNPHDTKSLKRKIWGLDWTNGWLPGGRSDSGSSWRMKKETRGGNFGGILEPEALLKEWKLRMV